MVSVVIPARDAAGTLGRTLDRLAAQEGVAFEVVVVDDGSADDTPRLAEQAEVVTELVRLAPGGISRARNLGVEAACAPLIAFTDADCAPASDWLRRGVDALRDADLVQGRVVPAGPTGTYDRTIRVDGLSGMFETANLFVRRDVLDRVGGFEPGFVPRDGKEAGEDVLLGWRVRRAGGRIAYAPDAVVEHAVFPRSAAGFVRSHRGVGVFAGLVARVPEMRDEVFYRRVFHTRRSACFDAAAAGVAVALAHRTPVPLALAAPYARLLRRDLRGVPRRRRPEVAAVRVAADAVACASLLRGSVRYRTVLL